MNHESDEKYLSFLESPAYNQILSELGGSNNSFAIEVLEIYGIGTSLNPDGTYDFASGQLLSRIPLGKRRYARTDAELVAFATRIAIAFAEYVEALSSP